MVELKLNDIDIHKLLSIIEELREMGWKNGVDFDFAYYKPSYDNFSYEAVTQRHVIFTFYNESNASYFMLRWG